MNRILYSAALIAGLASLCWVGSGYASSNSFALAMTVLMGGFFVMGALELNRFGQATASLAQAVSSAEQQPADLGQWLAPIHPSLQHVARLRIEGERVGLPGPSMTPYLAGLLVLLGMLGTFLGMVVTLKGTGLALESATDLQSIRDSLSAPVKGLGLAFGTSVAGVAASAMLGLMSALRKAERLQAGLALDACIASKLRVFSSTYQREQSLQLLQQQASLMPEMLDKLQAWMATMAQQGQHLNDRLLEGQQSFQRQAETAYVSLAASVAQSLQQSLVDSTRMAKATIEPVLEATMAGLARETSSLHHTISTNVQRQLDGLSTEFTTATARIADIWAGALSEQQRTNERLASDLRGTLAQFTGHFEERSTSLVETVTQRLDDVATNMSSQWSSALLTQTSHHEALSQHTQHALTAAAATFEQHAASLLEKIEKGQAHAQTQQADHDQARLVAWTASLQTMAAALRQEWSQAGAQVAEQLKEFSRTMMQTAGEVSAQTEAHAKATMAELAQLARTASDAPRAAAELMAQLREMLSDSMARDNTMLRERSHILETVSTLLDAVNHASTEQRAAIDALVTTSADMLERVGGRLTQTLDAHTDQMGQAAAQITGSAVEVASLGEAFGMAVQLFSQSNEKMLGQLQGIEGALSQSMARSNEQLDYYVAQAREVIDLSISSQKYVIDELQQLARHPSAAESQA